MKKVALLLLVAVCLGAGGVKAADAPARPDVKRCEPVTGSRIAVKPAAGQRCDKPSQPFLRSYSREELQSTGRVDLDEALNVLDPSITRRF